MRKLHADFLFGLGVIVVALVYLMLGQSIPTPQMADPLGPRLFPMVIGVGLLGAGGLVCFEAWSGGAADTIPAGDPGHSFAHWKPLLGMLLWTVVYYFCFVPVGYLVSTSCYVFGLLCVFHRGHHIVNVLVAVGFTAVIYAVFANFLGVDMPMGIIPL
jgi:putative tricarboxylic transport membrane protein